MPVTIARPFNTYGPRQSARAIIPTIITQIADGKKKIKLGDLTPTRDLNYVKDTCKGFIALLDNDSTIGKEINISSNYEISMANVVDKIVKIMGKEVEIITDQQRIRPENSEVFRLWGDNKLITKLTPFKPLFSIDEGLKETCKWFANKENLKKFKSDIYNV